MTETRFRNLPASLEIAEHADILLTANLSVPNGLLNGTKGTIVAPVFLEQRKPHAENPADRMPNYIIVDFPSYKGTPFWNAEQYPERKTWIPLKPQTIHDCNKTGISRT